MTYLTRMVAFLITVFLGLFSVVGTPTWKREAPLRVAAYIVVSDVEAGRRKPYDEEKTEKLIEFLQLTKEDIARMQDLAAKETAKIPKDLEETIMQTRAGDVIRAAVRMTRKGIADEDDWRRFVYYLKAKEAEINA